MKELLLRVAQQNQPGLTVLRISYPDKNLDGRILISDGRYVTAAGISLSEEGGYPALRKLLTVGEGNLALLKATGDENFDFDQSLNIELSRIIRVHPDLPHQASDLFDERALLDRVFGADTESSQARATAPRPVEGLFVEGPPPASSVENSWDLMQPLLDEESYPPGTVRLTPENKQALSHRGSSSQITTTRARAIKPLASSDPPKMRFDMRHFLLIGAVIVLAIVIWLVILGPVR